MGFILYSGYFIVGIMWTLYIHSLIENDSAYKEGYRLEISLAINAMIWPVCMLALAYARIFLKRDTLFVDKEDD